MHELKALSDALAAGVRRGALIHEKTGTALAVEIVAAEAPALIAVARACDGEHSLFRPDAKVRIELPLEGSVVLVPGRLRDFRVEGCAAEVEMVCDGAENRQRRMEVRIDSSCRIRLAGDGQVEETRTVNLSAGGALVVSESRARVGDRVDVELQLDGQPIACQAEVVRRGVKTNGAPSRTSAALKFVGLSDVVKERIALYVLRQQAAEKLKRR